MFAIHQSQAFFVTRAESNTKFKRRCSHPVDRANSDILFDQTGVLTAFYSSNDYPTTLRRIVVRDAESGKRVTFLTNNFAFIPDLIAQLYRQRWKVELFFKDQAAPAHQGISRHQRERREDANLDCSLHIPTDRYREETIQAVE